MPTYIEYEMEDGSTILVRMPDETGESAVIPTAVSRGEVRTERAERKFGEALESARKVAQSIKSRLEDLRADEVEITFGLETTGKLGSFAIAETAITANFEVKLKWKNEEKKG